MLAHSMFPHLAWAMWHRGSSTILNQDAEHEPKLSRNCCVSLERSVGFRGLHFSVLWSEEVGGNQYPTPLPPTLQPHPLSCFPWRGNVYYCTWVSWEETLTFSRYMPVSLKNTCHPQKSTSCFFFFLTEWFMIYFTEVKIASPTDEWVLIEGKSCLRDVDLCLLFSLSRWKFWRHLVV